MHVVAIQLSESDIRCFRVEPGYRIGHYLESGQIGQAVQNAILVVARIPTGTQAPKGRLPTAVLQAMLAEELKEVMPQPIARFPRWEYILENGKAMEVPDDTACEPLTLLPLSLTDRFGTYRCPIDGYTPLAGSEPAAVEPAAATPVEKPAKAEKGGG